MTRPSYECLCRYARLTDTANKVVIRGRPTCYASALDSRPRVRSSGITIPVPKGRWPRALAHLCVSVLPSRDQKSDVPVAVLLPRKRHDYYSRALAMTSQGLVEEGYLSSSCSASYNASFFPLQQVATVDNL